MKVAIITPYYKESSEILARCHKSILDQTHSDTSHIFVADGFPNDIVDSFNVVHLKLPNHNDYGDTPRALGGFSAVSLGYDAICFLDADNWLEPDHVATMVKKYYDTGSQVITATRNLYRIDGSKMGVCNESDGVNFNDTNCYFLSKPAFGAIAAWVLKDKKDGIIGDRIFWNTVQRMNLTRSHCMMPTVNYTTTLAFHYEVFGETPPSDSKVIARLEGEDSSRMFSYEDFCKLRRN